MDTIYLLTSGPVRKRILLRAEDLWYTWIKQIWTRVIIHVLTCEEWGKTMGREKYFNGRTIIFMFILILFTALPCAVQAQDFYGEGNVLIAVDMSEFGENDDVDYPDIYNSGYLSADTFPKEVFKPDGEKNFLYNSNLITDIDGVTCYNTFCEEAEIILRVCFPRYQATPRSTI